MEFSQTSVGPAVPWFELRALQVRRCRWIYTLEHAAVIAETLVLHIASVSTCVWITRVSTIARIRAVRFNAGARAFASNAPILLDTRVDHRRICVDPKPRETLFDAVVDIVAVVINFSGSVKALQVERV